MEQGDRNVLDCNTIDFKNPSFVIEKIISLMKEPITKNDFRRQKIYVDKLVHICSTGFFLEDLHNLMCLMELLLERSKDVADYVVCLDKILPICAIPPVMTLSSDILKFSRSFQEYFAMFGYILTYLQNEVLQLKTADAILGLLTEKIEYRWYVTLESRLNAALNSRLSEILAQMLLIVDENVYPKILDITEILIKETDEACKVFVEQDALNSLLARLEPTWKSRYPNKKPESVPKANVLNYEKFSIITLILLRYLAKDKNNLKNVKQVQLFSLWSLQYAFRLFTRTNQSLNRNNVTIILVKIIHLFPEVDFVPSGLAKDLTIVGLNSVYNKKWAKDVKLTSDDNDCLYLELLLSAIPLYLNYFGGIRVLEEQRIVYQLLAISRNKFFIKWSPQQVCVLSHKALDVLKKIVPCIEEEFIENGGPTMYL